jgi:hypothetical protein
VNGVERFPHIACVEPNQGILSDFGAMDGFRLDLFDGTFGMLLREARNS